jgi:FkbM family methyltransferase
MLRNSVVWLKKKLSRKTNFDSIVRETREYDIEGMKFFFKDVKGSETLHWVINEALIEDEYGLKNIEFFDNDIVLDIGANIGCISIYLAKKFPNIRILSYEAHPVNFQNLLENMEANGVTNVTPFNLAVLNETGKQMNIYFDSQNSGASSSYTIKKSHHIAKVETISLDDILIQNNISRLKLLKMDCEGAEFDILQGSQKINTIEIENLGIEIHRFMEKFDKNVDSLLTTINGLKLKNKVIKILG